MKTLCDDLRRFNDCAGVENRPRPFLPEDPADFLSGTEDSLKSELLDIAGRMQALSEKFKQVYRTSEIGLATRLILSETAETLHGYALRDMVEIADGHADSIYVHVQAAMRFGVPLEAVWDAVQQANIAKFPPCARCEGLGTYYLRDVDRPAEEPSLSRCIKCGGKGRIAHKDANGKVQKPPGWTAPDIRAILLAAGWTPPAEVLESIRFEAPESEPLVVNSQLVGGPAVQALPALADGFSWKGPDASGWITLFDGNHPCQNGMVLYNDTEGIQKVLYDYDAAPRATAPREPVQVPFEDVMAKLRSPGGLRAAIEHPSHVEHDGTAESVPPTLAHVQKNQMDSIKRLLDVCTHRAAEHGRDARVVSYGNVVDWLTVITSLEAGE